MSYIVTLERDYKKDHLRAVADDGIHGRANCKFPRVWRGISRYDMSNEGKQFEVSNLNWGNNCYSVSANDIIKEITSGNSSVGGSSATSNTKTNGKSKNPESTPEYTPEFEGERKVVSLADLLGLNEDLHSGESRWELIKHLEDLGYHYNWETKSDQALFKILQAKEEKAEWDNAEREIERARRLEAEKKASYYIDMKDKDYYDWVCDYKNYDIYKDPNNNFKIDGIGILFPNEREAEEYIDDIGDTDE